MQLGRIVAPATLALALLTAPLAVEAQVGIDELYTVSAAWEIRGIRQGLW